jgi:hypothetical protein
MFAKRWVTQCDVTHHLGLKLSFSVIAPSTCEKPGTPTCQGFAGDLTPYRVSRHLHQKLYRKNKDNSKKQHL